MHQPTYEEMRRGYISRMKEKGVINPLELMELLFNFDRLTIEQELSLSKTNWHNMTDMDILNQLEIIFNK